MPTVTMIAGPNGSGKSTLTRELQRLGIGLGRYLNADDVAANMRGDPRLVAGAAQQWVRDQRSFALNNGMDHSFETVMSHPSHIDHLAAARDAGFVTRLFFVATENPFINEMRVANRVLHGGHNVPFEKIAERYRRCLANLPAAIAASDEGLIYDNSGKGSPLVPFLRIADRELWLHPQPRNMTGMADWMRRSPKWWQELMQSRDWKVSEYRKIVPQ